MRELRRGLRHASPDAAVKAALAFEASGLSPASAAIYHAQGAELDAWPLAAVLARRGVEAALPVALAPDAPLAFRRAREGDALSVDASGVPAPGPEAEAMRPELIFAPCLAFDRFGGRLGQGGGYYDRTLAALRADGAPLTVIALAYAGQEVDRVPTDGHDARLDGVLTEAGLTLFGPTSSERDG